MDIPNHVENVHKIQKDPGSEITEGSVFYAFFTINDDNFEENKGYVYNALQKYESTLLHTYVLNEFLTAELSYTTKYLRKLL